VTGIRFARIFWIGAAGILVLAALVALTAVVGGEFSDNDGRILGTLAATLLAGSTLIAGIALVDRGERALGWAAVVVAAPAYATVVYAIWDFVFDGGGDSWRWGWGGVLVLVAALIAVTAQLMARTTLGVRLAWSAGVLAAGASAISLAAIWQDDPGDTIGKTLAVAWIFTGLTYLLIPVLHRFATAGAASSDERVIASLDDVELVLTRSRDGLEIELDPGERLILRRRESGFRPVGSDPG
jgi:hypothetical protein